MINVYKKAFILLILLTSITGCNNENEINITTSSSVALPPNPGVAGKATLKGIDSDEDGVRDDVQIAIFERYSNNAEKRTALEQNAKALQDSISNGNVLDMSAINQAAQAIDIAIDCLYETVDDPSSEISFIEDKVMNTSERGEAYIQFNGALSGQFFGEPSYTGSACQQ